MDIPLAKPCSLQCFNYQCFTGSMISKGELAIIPKEVGPRPVSLVMKEVSQSVGYRSARTLIKVLQCNTKPDPSYIIYKHLISVLLCLCTKKNDVIIIIWQNNKSKWMQKSIL